MGFRAQAYTLSPKLETRTLAKAAGKEAQTQPSTQTLNPNIPKQLFQQLQPAYGFAWRSCGIDYRPGSAHRPQEELVFVLFVFVLELVLVLVLVLRCGLQGCLALLRCRLKGYWVLVVTIIGIYIVNNMVSLW